MRSSSGGWVLNMRLIREMRPSSSSTAFTTRFVSRPDEPLLLWLPEGSDLRAVPFEHPWMSRLVDAPQAVAGRGFRPDQIAVVHHLPGVGETGLVPAAQAGDHRSVEGGQPEPPPERLVQRGDGDAATPAGGRGGRRFTHDEVVDLLAAAGLEPTSVQAVRVFSDLVPGSLLDLEPGATAALVELERAVATRPEYLPLAAQVHVVARRL